MKKILLFTVLLFAIIWVSRGDEQPPYDVSDPAVSENFRNIYLQSDKLSLLSTLFTYTLNASSNTFCIDTPTFCVDANNNTVWVGTNTITFPNLSLYAQLAATQTFSGQNTFNASATFASNGVFNAGSAASPSVTFTGATGTGLYRAGSDLNVTTAGTLKWAYDNSTGFQRSGGTWGIQAGQGSLSATAFGFVGDENTGMYSPSADSVALVTSGVAAISVTSAGEVTQQRQPMFLAGSTGELNVTGDGTVYKFPWTIEIYDEGSDLAVTTFTAPVGGKYFLSATVALLQVSAVHTVEDLRFATSNRNYLFINQFTVANSTYSFRDLTITALVDMDANDTCHVTISVNGGTKVVDDSGGAAFTYFSGTLIN